MSTLKDYRDDCFGLNTKIQKKWPSQRDGLEIKYHDPKAPGAVAEWEFIYSSLMCSYLRVTQGAFDAHEKAHVLNVFEELDTGGVMGLLEAQMTEEGVVVVVGDGCRVQVLPR